MLEHLHIDIDPRTLPDDQRATWHQMQDALERAWLDTIVCMLRPYRPTAGAHR